MPPANNSGLRHVHFCHVDTVKHLKKKIGHMNSVDSDHITTTLVCNSSLPLTPHCRSFIHRQPSPKYWLIMYNCNPQNWPSLRPTCRKISGGNPESVGKYHHISILGSPLPHLSYSKVNANCGLLCQGASIVADDDDNAAEDEDSTRCCWLLLLLPAYGQIYLLWGVDEFGYTCVFKGVGVGWSGVCH